MTRRALAPLAAVGWLTLLSCPAWADHPLGHPRALPESADPCPPLPCPTVPCPPAMTLPCPPAPCPPRVVIECPPPEVIFRTVPARPGPCLPCQSPAPMMSPGVAPVLVQQQAAPQMVLAAPQAAQLVLVQPQAAAVQMVTAPQAAAVQMVAAQPQAAAVQVVAAPQAVQVAAPQAAVQYVAVQAAPAPATVQLVAQPAAAPQAAQVQAALPQTRLCPEYELQLAAAMLARARETMQAQAAVGGTQAANPQAAGEDCATRLKRIEEAVALHGIAIEKLLKKMDEKK